MKRIFLCLYFLLTLAAGLQAENLVEATYNLRNAYRSDSLKGNDWGQHYPYIAGVVQFYGFDIFGTQESFCDQLQDLKRTLPEYDYIGARGDDGKKAGDTQEKVNTAGNFPQEVISDKYTAYTPSDHFPVI